MVDQTWSLVWKLHGRLNRADIIQTRVEVPDDENYELKILRAVNDGLISYQALKHRLPNNPHLSTEQNYSLYTNALKRMKSSGLLRKVGSTLVITPTGTAHLASQTPI
jgi:hypothetical protein